MTKEDRILEVLDEHTKILNEHTNDIKSLHHHMLIIEDSINNKIPTLFDAYSTHQEHIEKHDKQIEDLQSVTENHSLKLIVLEDTAKEHSEQLSNLLSAN